MPSVRQTPEKYLEAQLLLCWLSSGGQTALDIYLHVIYLKNRLTVIQHTSGTVHMNSLNPHNNSVK